MFTMDNKTIILAFDVVGTCKDLSVFLGLGAEAVVGPFKNDWSIPNEKLSETLFKIGVDSLDEAIAIFKKYNFAQYKDSHIRLMFWPIETMLRIPEIQLQSNNEVPFWQIYQHCQQYGTVVTVSPGRFKHNSPYRYLVYYLTKKAGQHALTEMNRKPPQINGVTLRVFNSKMSPDFWVPSKAPEKTEKARGNLIDVPTNNTRTTSGTHIIPGQQAPNKPKSQSSAAKSNPYTVPSKYKRDIGSSEEQRAFKTLSPISVEELSLQPGEIKGASCNPHLFETSMKTWCETAFICYETLHNLSSDSNQGTVHTSTLTWGSQLDISTFRMHYGSIFTPSGSERQYPVLSSLTVEMRQYGDKDSAAGVLAIRNNGQLPDSCDSSLTEGINVTTRAPVLSMKCLESGHLVASSGSRNTDYTLQVWDMRDQREKAEVPVAMLTRDSPKSKFWFDVQRTDVCSVDSYGVINSFDLYNAVSSGRHTTTANVDYTTMTYIDKSYSFYSSCISINSYDSTVLVGSGEHAQIARWDPRSPKDAFTSLACRRTEASSYHRRQFDPIYDISWNPSNSNEFITVHANAIRVWDARKMDHDGCSMLHIFEGRRLRRARWSPHHSDCIASLSLDGQVKIWKINKFDSQTDIVTGAQTPELLFVHQAHELIVSDFSWCPYDEDVIATVSPGIANTAGNIQVWRPRNLHDSDANGEP